LKKIAIIIVVSLVLLSSFTTAAQRVPESSMKTGAKIEAEVGQETQNQGEGSNIMPQVREATKAGNAQELVEIIREKQQEMLQEAQKEKNQEVFKNQNRIRLAVHALLASEDLIGGIGKNVSQIAREFNNSVEKTIRAEEKIKQRSGLIKFFLGGNKKAAEEIEQEVNKNQERIQQLHQLMDQCECSEEVKSMVQEQIQNLEEEQNRLRQLAEEEKQNKGIFGWLLK